MAENLFVDINNDIFRTIDTDAKWMLQLSGGPQAYTRPPEGTPHKNRRSACSGPPAPEKRLKQNKQKIHRLFF